MFVKRIRPSPSARTYKLMRPRDKMRRGQAKRLPRPSRQFENKVDLATWVTCAENLSKCLKRQSSFPVMRHLK